MDLHKAQNQEIQDFFEESQINNLHIPIINQYQESYLSEQNFLFQNRIDLIIEKHEASMQKAWFELKEESLSYNEESNRVYQGCGDQFQDILGKNDNIQESFQKIIKPPVIQTEQIQQKQTLNQPSYPQVTISETELEYQNILSRFIIRYLVENSNMPGHLLNESLYIHYPKFNRLPIVKTLIEKFMKLKKTKEELIKYCMRKAFKFILELPKNRHLLHNGQKNQKYSFSKCKNKYLKKISEQKSMNSRFLQQIFSERDFKKDYVVFLQRFQHIMSDDNEKKIKYLAWLLTNQKYGKMKSVEMVRRLPWTTGILERVIKISKELLRFAQQTEE